MPKKGWQEPSKRQRSTIDEESLESQIAISNLPEPKNVMQLGLTQNKIYETGSQKPMLDFELASLYDVPTKLFNQTLKRNSQRFPSGGMFRLIEKKFEILRSWIVTSKRGGTSYLPCAFIERGVAMLSSVCNSRKAIEVNTAIMRTLLLIRQYAMNDKEPQKIAEAGEEVQ